MVAIPFHTIMIALDESDVSEKAFTAAKELAKALSAKLIIDHVLDPHNSRSPQPLYRYSKSESIPVEQNVRERYEQEWENFVNYYRELLKRKADEAIVSGIEVDFLQPHGSPGSTLCEVAKTVNASLMVIGSHQRRGMAEIMLGSTSNYITHYSPCSVMVVYANDIEKDSDIETSEMNARDVSIV